MRHKPGHRLCHAFVCVDFSGGCTIGRVHLKVHRLETVVMDYGAPYTVFTVKPKTNAALERLCCRLCLRKGRIRVLARKMGCQEVKSASPTREARLLTPQLALTPSRRGFKVSRVRLEPLQVFFWLCLAKDYFRFCLTMVHSKGGMHPTARSAERVSGFYPTIGAAKLEPNSIRRRWRWLRDN
jgi:hypothetical protein